MAVLCTMFVPAQDNITIAMPAGADPGAYVVFVVACFGGAELGALLDNAAWLSPIAEAITDDLGQRFAVLGGIVPDPAPADVTFTCANATRWAAIGKAWTNVSAATPVADFDTFTDLDGGLTNSISVGPVTVPDDDARLVYCIASYQPSQASFEAGPAPAIASTQFGRTVAIGNPLEVGMWSEPANAGASAVYTQELAPAGGFDDVFCLAVLLALTPDCGA